MKPDNPAEVLSKRSYIFVIPFNLMNGFYLIQVFSQGSPGRSQPGEIGKISNRWRPHTTMTVTNEWG